MLDRIIIYPERAFSLPEVWGKDALPSAKGRLRMRLSKANKYSIHTARLMTREGHLLSWETKRSVWAANAVFAVWIPSKRFATKRHWIIQKAVVEQF